MPNDACLLHTAPFLWEESSADRRTVGRPIGVFTCGAAQLGGLTHGWGSTLGFIPLLPWSNPLFGMEDLCLSAPQELQAGRGEKQRWTVKYMLRGSGANRRKCINPPLHELVLASFLISTSINNIRTG